MGLIKQVFWATHLRRKLNSKSPTCARRDFTKHEGLVEANLHNLCADGLDRSVQGSFRIINT